MGSGIEVQNHYTFGAALAFMQKGDAVARAGWNGTGMFLFHASGGEAHNHNLIDGKTSFSLEPFIVMCTAQGAYIPWLASQADMLATDWFVL